MASIRLRYHGFGAGRACALVVVCHGGVWVVAHHRHRTQKSIHKPKLNRAGVVVEFARVEQAFVQRLAKFSDKGINTSARKVRRCEYTMHQIAKVVSDSVRIKLEKGRAIAVGLTCSLFLGKHA